MATSKRDVNLVVRAQDQASTTFESVAQALEALLSATDKTGSSAAATGSRLKDLGAVAGNLKAAIAQLAGAYETGEAALARQESRIAKAAADYDDAQRQAAALANVLKILQIEADKAFIGPKRDGLKEAITSTKADLKSLEAQIAKMGNGITGGVEALPQMRSSLQQIASTLNAATEAEQRLNTEIAVTTRTMQAQTAAAANNAKVLGTLATATGGTTDPQELLNLNAQIEAHNQLIAKLKAEQQAQTDLAQIEDARRRAATLLPGSSSTGGKSARDSAAVFAEEDVRLAKDQAKATKDAALAEEQMAAAAQRLRAAIDPLAAEEARLNRELAEADRLFKAGKISAAELAAAQNLLRASSEKVRASLAGTGAPGSKPTLFGLTPYAVTNLGYQVNDVVTQLASGTSLTQTLAQQGGQIIQIFPKAGAAIVAAFSNPAVIAFGAAIATIVLGLKNVGDEAERLREFQGVITAIAGASQDQAAGLSKAAKEIDRYGLSAAEALAITKTLYREGINPARINEFGIAAKNMADVLGIDAKQAAKQLADAFTGGYESIRKLDDSINFLTATEREHIRSLFDQGEAEKARSEAFAIFTRDYDEAAVKMRGSWASAAKALGGAWGDFMSAISDKGPIKDTASALEILGLRASTLINQLRGLKTTVTILTQIEANERTIQELTSNPGADIFGLGKARLERLKAENDALRAELATLQTKAAGAKGDTKGVNPEVEAKANENLQERMDALLAKQKTLSAAERIAAAEREASRQADLDLMEEGLRNADTARQTAYKQLLISQARQKVEKEIADEAARQAREAGNSLNQTIALIKQREGFIASAKYDVNAYRVGYGSDTTTDVSGRVSRVTASTTTTEEDALRDLTRRIGEFQAAIKETIGSDRFSAFNAQQQAALTSVAYNYGSLPDRIINAVKTGTASEIGDAIRGLGNDNNGVNRGRRNAEADLFVSAPNAALNADTQKLEQQRLDTQLRLKEAVQQENDARDRATSSLRLQNGLVDEALIREQKKQAIDDAVQAAQDKIDKENEDRDRRRLKRIDDLSEAEKSAIASSAAAYFDLARAKDVAAARAKAVDLPVQTLETQKAATQQSIDLGGGAEFQIKLVEINRLLDDARAKQIAFWQAVLSGAEGGPATFGKTAEQIRVMIQEIQNARTASSSLATQFIQTGQQINQSIANGVSAAFDRFAKSVAEGKNAVASLKDAFLQFASDFLRQIANMIVQQAIYNALTDGGKNPGGGAGGIISSVIKGLFKAPVAHQGGVIGSAGLPTRAVNPGWFTNAMRYHDGGIAGLKPGEIPAILKRGEVVDPGDGSVAGPMFGGAQPNIKIINAIDAGDMVQQGLNTKVGESAILNLVRNNPRAFRAAMG